MRIQHLKMIYFVLFAKMFSLANVFTTGAAASLLAGKHIKRARYAYQLTLAWFHVLKVQAYDEYCSEVYGPHEAMEMWEKRAMLQQSATGQQ